MIIVLQLVVAVLCRVVLCTGTDSDTGGETI